MSFTNARRPFTPRTGGWNTSSAQYIANLKARKASGVQRGSGEGAPEVRRSISHGSSTSIKQHSAARSPVTRPLSSPKRPVSAHPPENDLYNVPQKMSSRLRTDSSHGSLGPRRYNSQNEDLEDVAIKVCVRIRPLSAIEIESGDGNVTLCEGEFGGNLQMLHPSGYNEESTDLGQGMYSFDWVLSESCNQRQVYELLGERVVSAVADGFHGCIFAHGQTGSGKSHTIFGSQDDEGLLPRICDGVFSELEQGEAEYMVKLSYLEIYQEKLRDLLVPAVDSVPDLQVRKHPKFGVFVEGLTCNVVFTAEDVQRKLFFGHKMRVVGRTNMNAASSRSHAVVTLDVALRFPRAAPDDSGVPIGGTIRRHAQLHIIDLAGSERMKQVGNQGRSETTSETKQINKSLLALSLMISSLADQERGNTQISYVPYRNSKLTHILSDSLMGNCRTAMVACISPASSAFGVSISTLRFAASAKKIRTRPVKNEELEGTLISNLRAEIESLRMELSKVNGNQKKDLAEQLATTQLIELEIEDTETWNEKKAQAVHFDDQRKMTLEQLGVSNSSIADAWRRGNGSIMQLMNCDTDPYLVNVCDDPLLSGCLTYVLPKGEVVSVGSHAACKIQIEGLGVQPEMCVLVNEDGKNVQVYVQNAASMETPRKPTEGMYSSEKSDSSQQRRGSLKRRGSLFKTGIAQVFINHEHVLKSSRLRNGERLRIGRTHVFQLFIPRESLTESQSIASLCKSCNLAEQVLLEEYATHLKKRLGHARAQDVFSRLQDLQQLVDEANEITAEVRGGDNREFEFKAHILTDVSSAQTDPELAVVFKQTEKPLEMVRGSGRPIYPSQGPDEYIVVWSEQKFRQRVEVMRDLHTEIEDRDLPWGLPNDLDPWKDETGAVPLGHRRQGDWLSPTSGSRPSDPEPDAEPRGTWSVQGQEMCDGERLANVQVELKKTRLALSETQVQLQQAVSEAEDRKAAAEEAQSKLIAVEKELKKLVNQKSTEALQSTLQQSIAQSESAIRELRIRAQEKNTESLEISIAQLENSADLLKKSRQIDEEPVQRPGDRYGQPPGNSQSRFSAANSCSNSPPNGPKRSATAPVPVSRRSLSRSLSPGVHHSTSSQPALSVSAQPCLLERKASHGPHPHMSSSPNGSIDAKAGHAVLQQAKTFVVGPARNQFASQLWPDSPIASRTASSPAKPKAIVTTPGRATQLGRSQTPSRFLSQSTSCSPTSASVVQSPNRARQQLQNELIDIRQEIQSLEALCLN